MATPRGASAPPTSEAPSPSAPTPTNQQPANTTDKPQPPGSDHAAAAWLRLWQGAELVISDPDAAEAMIRSVASEEVYARPAHYAWVLREPTIYTLIETTIVDAAHRRGELALASGDVAKARWAAEKGLAIVDGQEAMYRMKMKTASDTGDLDGVNAAYREAQRAAESYGYDDEVQPETQELYDALLRSHTSSKSALD